MTISLPEFITQLAVNPVLRITVLLISGVILVNGWTDAPNAIASLVAAGGMKMREAVRMAAVFNFLGLFVLSSVNAKVASTICHIVDFGSDRDAALAALCAALVAIILWSAAAWSFGIPTSESHALIAGLTGAVLALRHGFAGIGIQEWKKVIYGLAVSVALGFVFGWLTGKLSRTAEQRGIPCVPIQGKDVPSIRISIKEGIRKAQIAGAAAMSFMHGAQDGQKFMGVFLLGLCLAEGKEPALSGSFGIPFWMMFLCSAVMALGTLIGGERIIRTVGNDMVRLRSIQGAAADAAGAFCLLLCSLAGIPVSTTHVKTTAIMGVGMAGEKGAVNTAVVKEMLLAWLVTFPCCGAIGYLTAGLFLHIIRE